MHLKSFPQVKEYVENLEVKSTEQLMIIVAEKSSQNVGELIEYLNSKNIKFFGGIYPRLIVFHVQCF